MLKNVYDKNSKFILNLVLYSVLHTVWQSLHDTNKSLANLCMLIQNTYFYLHVFKLLIHTNQKLYLLYYQKYFCVNCDLSDVVYLFSTYPKPRCILSTENCSLPCQRANNRSDTRTRPESWRIVSRSSTSICSCSQWWRFKSYSFG